MVRLGDSFEALKLWVLKVAMDGEAILHLLTGIHLGMFHLGSH